jgi:hypothetical protein
MNNRREWRSICTNEKMNQVLNWQHVENAREIHHKDQKLLLAKEKKLWKELQSCTR